MEGTCIRLEKPCHQVTINFWLRARALFSFCLRLCDPDGIYLFKGNNENTKILCEISWNTISFFVSKIFS